MIVGLGNRYRGDDAAGLLVAEALAGRVPDVHALENGGGADLLTLWQGQGEVIVVDAVRGTGPGEIVRLNALETPLPREALGPAGHGFGLADAVATARKLGLLPRSLVVYGIGGEVFTLGATPSAPVLAAVQRLVERLAAGAGG